MKKRILVLLFLLSLLLCPACADRIGYSILDELQVFPGEEDALRALELLDMDWQLNEQPGDPGDLNPRSSGGSISFSSSSGLIHCSYSYSPQRQRRTLSFRYEEELGGEYERFFQEDWPRFWSMMALFSPQKGTSRLSHSSRPAEAADLGAACQATLDGDFFVELNRYAREEAPAEPDWPMNTIYYQHRLAETICRVEFRWEPAQGRYLLQEIELKDASSSDRRTLDAELVKTTAEMPTAEEACYIRGRLLPMEEELPPLSPMAAMKAGLPLNTENYWMYLLQDEEGSLPVYVSPACMNEEGLYQIVPLPDAPGSYALSFSTSNYGIGK